MCVDQVFTISLIMEKIIAKNKYNVYMGYMDLEKTIDIVLCIMECSGEV